MKNTNLTSERYYGNGYAINSITGIDEFGRAISPSRFEKIGKRHIGFFYFLFLQTNNDTEIYNTSDIFSMPNGIKLLTQMYTDVSPNGKRHFWR